MRAMRLNEEDVNRPRIRIHSDRKATAKPLRREVRDSIKRAGWETAYNRTQTGKSADVN